MTTKMNATAISKIGLDPLFQSYRKILIYYLHHNIIVNTHDNLLEFNIFNRSISKVEIVGIIVKREIKRTNKIMLVIDDGTGIVTCNKVINSNNINDSSSINIIDDYKLGDLVTIRGKITMSSYTTTNDNNEDKSNDNSHDNNIDGEATNTINYYQ